MTARAAPAARHALAVAEITAPTELEGLRAEWGELWARAPDVTPFQAPEWLIPWWRAFRPGELAALAVRRGNRLVALAPLYCAEGRLLPIGIGISDWLDALIDPADSVAAAEAILDHIAAGARLWRICALDAMPAHSPLLAVPAPRGWSDRIEDDEVCPLLELPESADQLMRKLPRVLRRNLQVALRRAASLGAIELERADAETAPALLERLMRLHAGRWAVEGQPGVLADPAVQRFHTDALGGLLARGVLRLYGLRIGGHVLASYYGFVHRGRAYAYLSGFDPGHPRQSLGTLMIFHAIIEAMREGARSFDFLRGREAYKYAWGGVDRPSRRRILTRGAAVA